MVVVVVVGSGEEYRPAPAVGDAGRLLLEPGRAHQTTPPGLHGDCRMEVIQRTRE